MRLNDPLTRQSSFAICQLATLKLIPLTCLSPFLWQNPCPLSPSHTLSPSSFFLSFSLALCCSLFVCLSMFFFFFCSFFLFSLFLFPSLSSSLCPSRLRLSHAISPSDLFSVSPSFFIPSSLPAPPFLALSLSLSFWISFSWLYLSLSLFLYLLFSLQLPLSPFLSVSLYLCF